MSPFQPPKVLFPADKKNLAEVTSTFVGTTRSSAVEELNEETELLIDCCKRDV